MSSFVCEHCHCVVTLALMCCLHFVCVRAVQTVFVDLAVWRPVRLAFLSLRESLCDADSVCKPTRKFCQL